MPLRGRNPAVIVFRFLPEVKMKSLIWFALSLLVILSQFLSQVVMAPVEAAPAPEHKKESEVKTIKLPPGDVKWENVKTKDGMIIRVTCGKNTTEGKCLFYGDGKVAIKVVATDEGMEFVHAWGMEGPGESSGSLDGDGKWFVINGSQTDKPGMIWLLEPDAPTAGDLKAGNVYIVTPSIKFERKARPDKRKKSP
jgi:hypothetical protein